MKRAGAILQPFRPRSRGLAAAGSLIALVMGLLLLAQAGPCRAAAVFPALTGRVLDDANLLSAASQSGIETKLKTLEDKSGIQLVVATVKSLGGDEIEPYANRLFRAWKLGEKTKNNGVLMLVAPTERKARIEVGYGLEGTLTDALSKLIIVNAMSPRFKAGDFQGGIERGVDDVIAVLSTDSAEWQKRPDLQAKAQDDGSALAALIPFLIVIGVIVLIVYLRRRGRPGGMVFIPTVGSSWTSSSSGGNSLDSGGSSSSDSGFSGGGGSSGGGGASGDW